VGILSTAKLRDFYAEYVAAWNRRDMERYYSLYSENLVFRDGIEVLHGVDALRERYESELAAFPDLTIECERLLVDAERKPSLPRTSSEGRIAATWWWAARDFRRREGGWS
jgi:predicted ester cyclase